MAALSCLLKLSTQQEHCIAFILRRHQTRIRKFSGVLKDIPFQDALAKFKSIHSDVLSSSPVLVRTNRHGFDAVNVIKFLEELSPLANVKIDTD